VYYVLTNSCFTSVSTSSKMVQIVVSRSKTFKQLVQVNIVTHVHINHRQLKMSIHSEDMPVI